MSLKWGVSGQFGRDVLFEDPSFLRGSDAFDSQSSRTADDLGVGLVASCGQCRFV